MNKFKYKTGEIITVLINGYRNDLIIESTHTVYFGDSKIIGYYYTIGYYYFDIRYLNYTERIYKSTKISRAKLESLELWSQ